MRISDWSSDVCSSDLDQADQPVAEVERDGCIVADFAPLDSARRLNLDGLGRPHRRQALLLTQFPRNEARDCGGGKNDQLRHARDRADTGQTGGDRPPGEIGRATVRTTVNTAQTVYTL